MLQITSMEALSWETAISRRAAMGKTNLKELCNCNARNLPSQLDIRCLQDSSQHPSQPHPKIFSTTKPFLRNFPLNRGTEKKYGASTKLHSKAFKHELSQSSANGSNDNYRILSSLHGIAEAQQSNGKSNAEQKTGDLGRCLLLSSSCNIITQIR